MSDFLNQPIKKALYTFDQYQTYDLLWFELHYTHLDLLKSLYPSNWILRGDYGSIPIILIDRFTPDPWDWAREYSQNLYYFFKQLSQWKSYENPWLEGTHWAVENPSPLINSGLEGIVTQFPEEIQVTALEDSVITWLEFTTPIPRKIHPSFNQNCLIINKKYKVLKKGKTITLSTENWLINSLVVTGQFVIIADNSDLLFYAYQQFRLQEILDILNPYPPQVVQGIKYRIGVEQYYNRTDLSAPLNRTVAQHFNQFSIELVEWKEVPDWYHFAALQTANNNYWNNDAAYPSLGKDISVKHSSGRLSFAIWDLGYFPSPIYSIQDNIFILSEEEYHTGYQDTLIQIHTLNNAWNYFDFWIGGSAERSQVINFYNSNLPRPSSSEPFQKTGLFASDWYGSLNIIEEKYALSFNSFHLPFSIRWDMRLVQQIFAFDWVPYIYYQYRLLNGEGQLWIKSGSRIFQDSIRLGQIPQGMTYSNFKEIVEDSLSIEFSASGLAPNYFPYISPITVNKTIDFYSPLIFWDNPPECVQYHSDSELELIIENLFQEDYDPEEYVMPDSIRIKEIHAALGADYYAADEVDPTIPRVHNLGRMIELSSYALGLSFNSDGSIRSIRQSKHIPQGGTIPAGWSIGQFGVNNGDSQDGQPGGNESEQRLGLAYEVRTNRLTENPITGEKSKIEEGGYILVENLPQLLHILMNDIDKALGMQDLGALVVPSADKASFFMGEGLARVLGEILYNQSSISKNTSRNEIGSLKNQAMLQEILRAIGCSYTVKGLDVPSGEEEPYKIPYPGMRGDAPALMDVLWLILSNIAPLLVSKLYFEQNKEIRDMEPVEEEN